MQFYVQSVHILVHYEINTKILNILKICHFYTNENTCYVTADICLVRIFVNLHANCRVNEKNLTMLETPLVNYTISVLGFLIILLVYTKRCKKTKKFVPYALRY